MRGSERDWREGTEVKSPFLPGREESERRKKSSGGICVSDHHPTRREWRSLYTYTRNYKYLRNHSDNDSDLFSLFFPVLPGVY